MLSSLHTLLVLFIIVPPFAQASISECDAFTSEGKCVSYFINSGISWTEARANCQSWGGELASISTSSEDSKLDSIRNVYVGRCWIGYNDRETEGVYKWTDGSYSGYTNWEGGQPDNHLGMQNCATKYLVSPRWDDDNCATLLRCYFCSATGVSQRITSIQTETYNSTSILVSWRLLRSQTVNLNETFSVYYSIGGAEVLVGTTNSLTYNITGLTPDVNYGVIIEVAYRFNPTKILTFSLKTFHFLKAMPTPTIMKCSISNQVNNQTNQVNNQTNQVNNQTNQVNSQTNQVNNQTNQVNNQTNQVSANSNFQFSPQLIYVGICFGSLYLLTIILSIFALFTIICCYRKGWRKDNYIYSNEDGTKLIEAPVNQPHPGIIENKCYIGKPEVDPSTNNPIYMEISEQFAKN